MAIFIVRGTVSYPEFVAKPAIKTSRELHNKGLNAI